jgi:hypothetical protein
VDYRRSIQLRECDFRMHFANVLLFPRIHSVVHLPNLLHDVKSLFRDADAHEFAVQAQCFSESLGVQRPPRRRRKYAAGSRPTQQLARGGIAGSRLVVWNADRDVDGDKRVDAGSGKYRIELRLDIETQVAQIRSRPRDNPSAAAPVDSV